MDLLTIPLLVFLISLILLLISLPHILLPCGKYEEMTSRSLRIRDMRRNGSDGIRVMTMMMMINHLFPNIITAVLVICIIIVSRLLLISIVRRSIGIIPPHLHQSSLAAPHVTHPPPTPAHYLHHHPPLPTPHHPPLVLLCPLICLISPSLSSLPGI